MLIVAAIGWSLSLVVGIAVVALVAFMGDTVCDSKAGDSNYGQLRWSLVPPGHECVWTKDANGIDAAEGPSWYASTYLVVMLASGVAIVRVARQTRE